MPIMVSGTRNGINSVASKDRGINANPTHCVFAGEAQLGSPSHASPWQHGEQNPRVTSKSFVWFSFWFLFIWRKYLGAGDGEVAGGPQGQLSSRRGRKDGCTHKYCCRWAPPATEGREGSEIPWGQPGGREGKMHDRYAQHGTELWPLLTTHTFSPRRNTCLFSSSALNRLPRGAVSWKPRQSWAGGTGTGRTKRWAVEVGDPQGPGSIL